MKASAIPIGAILSAMTILASAACSAPPGDEVDEETQDLTSSYVFHCRAAYRATGSEIASIRLSKTRATLTAVGPSLNGVAAIYKYNPDYHPRSASYQGYSQYAWTDAFSHKMVLLFDDSMRSGGAVLPSGGHGGDVTLEGPRISHGIESMICTR